jgi:hypothetical protein
MSSPTSASSSQSSICGGTTATAVRISFADELRGAARANTASRTVSGTSSPSAAIASTTKNGFPPVFR